MNPNKLDELHEAFSEIYTEQTFEDQTKYFDGYFEKVFEKLFETVRKKGNEESYKDFHQIFKLVLSEFNVFQINNHMNFLECSQENLKSLINYMGSARDAVSMEMLNDQLSKQLLKIENETKTNSIFLFIQFLQASRIIEGMTTSQSWKNLMEFKSYETENRKKLLDAALKLAKRTKNEYSDPDAFLADKLTNDIKVAIQNLRSRGESVNELKIAKELGWKNSTTLRDKQKRYKIHWKKIYDSM